LKAFRCTHSGLYFPGDYRNQWGRKYGHGLGPHPVSEVLDTVPFRGSTLARGKYNCDDDDIMMPFAACCAPVVEVDVTEAEFNKNKAVLNADDRDFHIRSKILQEKQKKKPEWEKIKALLGNP